MLPIGDYRYEIRRFGEIVAIEEARLDGTTIVAGRRSADGLSHHQVEAALDTEHHVSRVMLHYSSSLFTRKASYEAVEDNFSGHISALASRNEIVVKLGRFREVDAVGLVIFRALLIDHMRKRGQARWTGRVAVIDPNTLVAASIKQNCAQRDGAGRFWNYEARMGDTEEIELDDAGRITRRRDNRGLITELVTPQLQS
jgi:hypothetical protein